ncbi:hypothetical protein [Streptomyces sp. NPDC002537]
MMMKLLVDIRPSLVARPFHLLFTRPLVEIDGVESEARWGTTEIPVGTGPHEMAVYFRYRGQRRARLGLGRKEFTADDSVPRLRARAALGPFNGSHFRIAVG